MHNEVMRKTVLEVAKFLAMVAIGASGFLHSVGYGFATLGLVGLLGVCRNIYNANLAKMYEKKGQELLALANKLKLEYAQLYQTDSTDPKDRLRLKGIESEMKDIQTQAEALMAEAEKKFL